MARARRAASCHRRCECRLPFYLPLPSRSYVPPAGGRQPPRCSRSEPGTLTRPLPSARLSGDSQQPFSHTVSPMLSRTTRSVAILSSVAVAIHGGCAAAATAQQPNSGSRTGPPRVGTVDTLHGTLVPDPYRWLERTDSSPVRAWVRDQD